MVGFVDLIWLQKSAPSVADTFLVMLWQVYRGTLFTFGLLWDFITLILIFKVPWLPICNLSSTKISIMRVACARDEKVHKSMQKLCNMPPCCSSDAIQDRVYSKHHHIVHFYSLKSPILCLPWGTLTRSHEHSLALWKLRQINKKSWQIHTSTSHC